MIGKMLSVVAELVAVLFLGSAVLALATIAFLWLQGWL